MKFMPVSFHHPFYHVHFLLMAKFQILNLLEVPFGSLLFFFHHLPYKIVLYFQLFAKPLIFIAQLLL